VNVAVYLDCNATTPVEPQVAEAMSRWLRDQVGNAGSPHAFGSRAKQAVQQARDQVGRVVAARRHEVVFTSGATEANNLAILGLAAAGEQSGRRHLVSTQIEHKAVLEPLAALQQRGFRVSLVPVGEDGRVRAEDVLEAVTDQTLLVSVMQANNETGVTQPIAEIAERLAPGPMLHVDAAQGFGKQIEPLQHPRIDLISISGHKVYGPQGIGALVTRRRSFELPPVRPLTFGGGHELGLRPGTLPVQLIVGFGLAAELALAEHRPRAEICRAFGDRLSSELARLQPMLNGDSPWRMPHTVNLSIPGVDADDAIEQLHDLVAVSNGSACTSICDTASHVLQAMGLNGDRIDGALRFSWCHRTPDPAWKELVRRFRQLQQAHRQDGSADEASGANSPERSETNAASRVRTSTACGDSGPPRRPPNRPTLPQEG